MKQATEYDNFNSLMSKLIQVPHSEVKEKLDEEKRAKKKRKSTRALSPDKTPRSRQSKS